MKMKNISENISEKEVDGEIIKYNSTTHIFESHQTDDGYTVTTRRVYSTTKDLLEKTNNYEESCYIGKNYNSVEFNTSLTVQEKNIRQMDLNQSSAADLEKYCKYTK